MKITRSVTRALAVINTDASRRAVLDTTELLEAVLLQRPPKQILLLQQVSRRWNATIAKSASLQMKLFRRRSENTRDNEVLDTRRHESGSAALHTPRVPTPVRLNPFCQVESQPPRIVKVGMATRNKKITFSIEKPLSIASASWHRVLITEPPCRRASVRIGWWVDQRENGDRNCINHWSSAEVENSEGLTIGGIVFQALSREVVSEITSAQKSRVWIQIEPLDMTVPSVAE